MAEELKDLKLTKEEVSQTINLKEEFGFDPNTNTALADRVGQALIDKMVQRTLSSKRVDGGKFKGYSEDYKESDEFKAFGKTNKVNMQQTGNMLGQIDITETTGETIKIGWTDEEENAKAYNHNVGDTVPKRPFFGVRNTDIKEVRSQFTREIEEAKGLDTFSQARSVGDLVDRFGSSLILRQGQVDETSVVDIFSAAALRLLDGKKI